MRHAPNATAELIMTLEGWGGWCRATYRFPCGHERVEQYFTPKVPPVTRRLFHECSATSADTVAAAHEAEYDDSNYNGL